MSYNLPADAFIPSGSGASSIKLRKTNSCNSSATSISAQSFELQSDVPPVPESLPCLPMNIYSQSLRMSNEPVSVEHSMIPTISSDLMTIRKRSVSRATSEREVSMGANLLKNSGSVTRSTSMSPPIKCVATDRISCSNSTVKTSRVGKSLIESHTSTNSSSVISRQNVLNLNAEQKFSINEDSNVIDLTASDNGSCDENNQTCQMCSKIYPSIEELYEHIYSVHKPITQSYHCNLCSQVFPHENLLNRHKTSFHRVEVNPNSPLVIPILDINHPDIARLKTMGVTSYLPVTQLDNQGGKYGVPIMSISQPGSVVDLKYQNLFNLGYIQKKH